METHIDLLFNDSELRIKNAASMTAASAIPIQASSNFSMPWGAPLYGLTLEAPQFLRHNATHLLVVVPTSFDNHAFFDIVGNIQLNAYDNANVLIGRSETSISAPEHSQFRDDIEFYVPLSAGRIRYFEVFISTPFFVYGPLVIPYVG
jgi:hypothetical protein